MTKGTASAGLTLGDGSRVAVIGGGPSGTFFSLFALKMARMVGKEIDVTIYEPKDFSAMGPAGCNRCGGIISEIMVQTLALEGINLPTDIVQRGINSYVLHTGLGDVRIETPSLERTIATVYRGGGPASLKLVDKRSFDQFLLEQAVAEGAGHVRKRVDRVAVENGRPVLYSGGEELTRADLVVGAFGVDQKSAAMFEGLGFGYRKPELAKTAIAEILMDAPDLQERIGDSVHLFLLPINDFKFAAIIPKKHYVSLCILGTDLNRSKVQSFLEHPAVRRLIPVERTEKLDCLCLPHMNVGAPAVPFADRIVMCGDAGSTRLFKDGIGAAYLMGKAAAKTVVFQGVGREHFGQSYQPVYREIIHDNRYGSFLFWATDYYRKYGFLTASMLNIVRDEQRDDTDDAKLLSTMLWNMFTGNERYKNVFWSVMKLGIIADTLKQIGRYFTRGSGRVGGPG